MPVFRYAIKRILTSPASYAIFLIFLVTGTLILIITPQVLKWYQVINATILWKSIYFIILLFFSAFFVGTLISKTITEEIDDGTFLLIISKPLSRIKIWSQKMLAIFVVMLTSYLIMMFLPLISFFVPTENYTWQDIFDNIWPDFRDYFFNGLLIHLFIFGTFSMLAYFLSSRSLLTSCSIFVTILIVINVTLTVLMILPIFHWLKQIYVYVPLILISVGFIVASGVIFNNKNFI